MKTSNLARDGGVIRNAMRNRRAYLSVPTLGSLSRPRRRLGTCILASALLVSIIALAWNGQPAKAKSIPMFIPNQYGQSPGTRALEPLDFQKTDGAGCRATGEACFLGIDPDVYQMPLFGEYIQSGDRLICATRNWSSYPAEAFNIDFMRAFWPQIPPQDQAATEGAAFFFVTTHWGPPNAPAADLSEVVTPSHFANEVFKSLEGRTVRIEFEVPKTDFETLGWRPTSLLFSVPPDSAPTMPHKLRGWYIR